MANYNRAKFRTTLLLKCLESRVTPTISWVAQGPGPIINAQVEGMAAQNNPVSGAVTAVLPHPTDVNTLYVGTTNGGVWKTTNATNTAPTWTALTDEMPSQSILELSFDPTDASSNTVLAGIGRNSSFSLDGSRETGILRTTDGGGSWATLGTTTLANVRINGIAERGSLMVVTAATSGSSGGVWRSTDNGLTFTFISGTGGLPAGSAYDLVEDPSNPNRIYVATTGGIFRSLDFGVNWTAVTPPASGITVGIDNVKMAVHSNGANNALYVGVVASRRLTGIFRSADFGATWQTLDIPEVTKTATTPITGATNASPIVITSNAHGQQTGDKVLISGVGGNTAANGTWTITRIDANTFSLNGSTGNGAYTSGGVWQAIQGLQPIRAVNGAPSFRNPNDVPPAGEPYPTVHIAEPPGGQGSIHFSIVADPTNANLVYLGGDRQPLSRGSNTGGFPNSIGAVNFTGRLFRGNAAAAPGSQWTPLTHNFTSNGSSPHADSRDMAFDAAGNLIEGDDGGPYKRTSPATNTGQWVALVGNLQNNEIYPGGVAYDSLNNVFTAGAQDTGSFMQSAPNSAQWFQTNQGDGGAAAAAIIGGNSVRYHSAQNIAGFTRKTFNSSNVQISSVGVGLNVTAGGGTLGFLNNVDSVQFVTPVELNAFTPTRIAIATNNYVYESTNQGDSLTRLNFGTEASFVRSLAYGAIGNADLLWFGGNNAATQLMVRTTAGGAFSLVTTFPGFYTKDIAVDTASSTTAYIVDFNNGVYRTTDNGATAGNWTNLTGNLNTAYLGDVRSVTRVPGFVVVGKQNGVFFMRDSAPGVWHRLGGAFPNVPVNDVRYDATDNLLYAGTLGRGVWSFPGATTELAEAIAPTASITAVTPDPTSTPVTSLTITFSEPVNGLDLADFSFKRGGTPLTLNAATQTLSTTDFKTYTLGNLGNLTTIPGTYSLDLPAATAGVVDGAGNLLANSPNETFTFTTGVPNVTNVASSLANGTYLPNVAVPVQITFDTAVTVTGKPTLTLETGAIDAVATYVSGTGTSTLTFQFTTVHGYTSADLEYASTTALALAGGTIKSSGGTAANLTLPTPGGVGSLSGNNNIVIQPRATASGYTPVSISGSFSQVDITFAQTMDTASFSVAADVVSFTGPGGNLVPAITGFTWPTATTLRVTFATQTTNGNYTLVLGPQILSASGANPLDQDADNTPGEAVDDRFTAVTSIIGLVVSEVSDIDDGNFGVGKLSIREAVNLANTAAGVDVITFDPTVFASANTITLTKGVLSISDGTTINGPGSGLLTINGGGANRIFFVNATGTGNAVTLSGMRLTNGNSGASNHGGAIYNEDEALTLNNMLIEGNTGVVTGGGIRLQTAAASLTTSNTIIRNNVVATGTGLDVGDGGGISIRADSVVTLTNSTLSGNTANDDGGGIYFFVDGTLNLNNSTISGNTATLGDGGGIYAFSTNLNIINSTLSGNSAVNGGAVVLFSSSPLVARNSTIAFNTATTTGGGILVSSGTVTLESTIVAKNTNAASPDIGGTAAGTNALIGSTTGATITGSGNKLNVDPLLAALANNGGTTQTHALLTGSPALNFGSNSLVLTTDQRGAGFARVFGAASDIGAYEVQSIFVVTNTADSGTGSLRAAIANSNANPGADTITFDAMVFGTPQTITLSTGELAITDSVVITGPGAKNATVSGNNSSRVFNIDIDGAGNVVQVSGLTIAGGKAGNGAGILLQDDALTVIDSTITANTATINDGGGIHVQNAGTLTVRGSTFFANAAIFGAAIDFYSAGGTLVMENSTLSGNSASSVGGGIYFSGAAGAGMSIRNSTITANTAIGGGGGIYRTGTGASPINLISTIVSGNSGNITPDIFSPGTVNVNFSAIGSNAGFTVTGANNLGFGVDLKLAPLAFNGGTTHTHALLGGSPAINTGDNPAPSLTADQRGTGFARTAAGGTDIGAFEAQGFIVYTTADSGIGSLRQAVTNANALAGADAITFDPVVFATPQTITLTTGELGISEAVTITGPGSAKVSVSGNKANRIFNLTTAPASAVITITDMTLTNGSNATDGGAILVTDEFLTLERMEILGNVAPNGAGVRVVASGALTVRDSTFGNNSASNQGGGITISTTAPLLVERSTFFGNITTLGNSGGAIRYVGNPGATGYIVRNSTFFGNSTGFNGGALGFSNLGAGAVVVIENSTIVGNTAGGRGGIGVNDTATAGTLNIINSIVTDNVNTVITNSGKDIYVLNAGVTVNVNNSAYTDATGFTPTGAGNIVGQNMKLAPLAFNGGFTKTMLPAPDSPALNSGTATSPLTTDQRGLARLFGSKVDMGAVEFQSNANSFTVNNGNAQRSRITTITINFNSAVNAADFNTLGAISLTRTAVSNPATGTIGDVVQTGPAAANHITVAQGTITSIVLTFDNNGLFNTETVGVENGSLSDGYWQLRLGDFLNTTNDLNLRRLFGDSTNTVSGQVSGDDFLDFGNFFNSSDSRYDYNNDGSISGADALIFGNRFGRSL